jgi:hypothetical protein
MMMETATAAMVVRAPDTRARQSLRCRKKMNNRSGKILHAAAMATRAPAMALWPRR